MSRNKLGKHTIVVELDSLDVATIQSKTPVQTGQLRDGFRTDADGNIENNVDYANEVELGTTTRPGRFMVTQSVPEIAKRLEKRVAEQIDKPGLIPPITIKINIGGK